MWINKYYKALFEEDTYIVYVIELDGGVDVAILAANRNVPGDVWAHCTPYCLEYAGMPLFDFDLSILRTAEEIESRLPLHYQPIFDLVKVDDDELIFLDYEGNKHKVRRSACLQNDVISLYRKYIYAIKKEQKNEQSNFLPSVSIRF